MRSAHDSKKPDNYRPYQISHISSENHDSYRYRVKIPTTNSFKFDTASSSCVKFVSLPPEISIKCNTSTTIPQPDTQGMLQRSYTPVNDSNNILETNELEFIIKLYSDGEMSNVLRELTIGDTIWIRDPKIKIAYPFAKNKSKIIMIAGGTGFTPMLDALMHHLEYGNNDVKLLFVWFNRKPVDLCCLEQFDWFCSNYPKRFFVNLVFSEPADDPIGQEIIKKWKQRVATCIYYNKWNAEECVEVISKFFKDGKVTDVRIAAPVAISVPIGIDKNAKKVGPATTLSGEDGNGNGKAGTKEILNKHDRIILSGPKLFVEKFLTWIRDGKEFAGTNIGKQIICYD